MTEQPVVQLEIPPRWILWRVYHAEKPLPWDPWWKYYDEEDEYKIKDTGRDLQVQWAYDRYYQCGFMDENDLDEEVSFPTLKPDRDLFGPPLRRGRKQRGWHYVKPWPPAVKADAAPQQHATGANIPQELFDNILDHCLHGGGCSRGDVKQLRLVCRRWETLSLRKMFDEIILRDHQGTATLSTLVDQRKAHSRLAAYPVRSVGLRMDVWHAEGWRPWVDLPRLLPKLKGVEVTTLTVLGPLPAGRRLTSVYLSSPSRSFWSPLPIRELHLFDVHFRKLDDLVRLLRELPYLYRVGGSDITWDKSEEYPRLTSFIPCANPHLSIGYSFHDIHLSRIFACALSLSGSTPVAQADTDILYGLVSALKPVPQPFGLPARFRSGLYICESTSSFLSTLVASMTIALTPNRQAVTLLGLSCMWVSDRRRGKHVQCSLLHSISMKHPLQWMMIPLA